MIKSSSLRFAVLLVAIVAAGVLVNMWAYLGEAHVDRKALKDFPQQLDGWSKSKPDQVIDDETMKVLRASDYVLRDYRRSDGRQRIFMSAITRASAGRSYHSPLNCLPGAGWTLNNPDKVTISLPDGNRSSLTST